MAKAEKTANPISIAEIGLVKKILIEPPDIWSEERRFCSNIGPRMNPNITGATGQFPFFIA
jgi:hypothetical protein